MLSTPSQFKSSTNTICSLNAFQKFLFLHARPFEFFFFLFSLHEIPTHTLIKIFFSRNFFSFYFTFDFNLSLFTYQQQIYQYGMFNQISLKIVMMKDSLLTLVFRTLKLQLHQLKSSKFWVEPVQEVVLLKLELSSWKMLLEPSSETLKVQSEKMTSCV